ncbi:MAG: hydrogenase, partial [Leptospiraceae bacterium]|nr:hydrogenase [Leptospiraceae bacterium]
TKPINSPTTKQLIAGFLNKAGGGKHLEYDATSPEGSIARANELCYGKAVVPNYHFDKAKVILSVEADFLGTWISPVEFAKQFSKGRRLSESDPSLNQLFVIESMPSVTGSNADSRYPIKPENARKAALAIAKALEELGANSFEQLKDIDLSKLAQEIEVKVEWIQKVAKALYSAKGESLVVGNGDVDLQIAINLLNSMLDNDGKTVDYVSHRGEGVSYSANLETLKKALESGEVGVLFLYGTNLLYQMPEHLGWKNLLSKAKLIVSLDDRINETAVVANYLAPASHSLESWGDFESVNGVVGIAQPTINPLYDTRQFEDVLITFAGGEIEGFTHYYDYLKSSYTKTLGDKGWISLLKAGFTQKGNYV